MKIKLVGIDLLTIKVHPIKRKESGAIHRSLLGRGILICEALNLENILEGIYEFLCILLNISEADGCSVRCVLSVMR